MNLKNYLPILMLLTLSSTLCWANRKDLNVGDKAPFAGVLLTREALAKIITDYEVSIKTLRASLEKQEKESKAESTAAKAMSDANLKSMSLERDACQREMANTITIYKNSLKKCDVPWYKTGTTGFIFGQIVMGGICVGAQQLR